MNTGDAIYLAVLLAICGFCSFVAGVAMAWMASSKDGEQHPTRGVHLRGGIGVNRVVKLARKIG